MEGYEGNRYNVDIGGMGLGDDLYVVVTGEHEHTFHGDTAVTVWLAVKDIANDEEYGDEEAASALDSYLDGLLA